MKISKIVAAALMICLLLMGVALAEGGIDVQVSVDGMYPEDTYTIQMKPDNAAYPMPAGSEDGVYTLKLDGPGSGTIPQVETDKLGIYTYTIRQLKGDCKFVEANGYDSTVYKYTVAVTKNKSTGKPEAQSWLSVDGKDEKPDKCSFVNRYVDPTPVKHDPPVKKIINTVPSGNPDFTFKLKAVSNNVGIAPKDMPIPTGGANGEMTVKVKAGEEREFGWLVFDREGQYVYTITEVNTGLANVAYDSTVYQLTYDITLNRKTWEYEKQLTIRKDGSIVDKATFDFTNKYTPTDDTPEKKEGPKTGVQDYWPYLLAGALVLVLAAVIMLVYLRRSRDNR